MNAMYELKDMLCDELEKITKKGELSAGSLDVVDKLTHSIKSLETIIAMKESGYSQGNGNSYYGYGNSYARGRTGNVKRDSMGRYSRERGGYSRGYSREDGKEEMISQLEDIMQDATDEKMRKAIQKCISQIDD